MVNYQSESSHKMKRQSTGNNKRNNNNNNQLDSMVNPSEPPSVLTARPNSLTKRLLKSSASSLTNYGYLLIVINLLTFTIYTNGVPIEEVHHNVARSIPSSKVYYASPDVIVKNLPYVTGVHAEQNKAKVNNEGVNIIFADTLTTVRIFGIDLTNETIISLTTHPMVNENPSCDDFSRTDALSIAHISHSMGFITLNLPKQHERLYMCAKNQDGQHQAGWYHQGNDPWLTFEVEGQFLPFWLHIIAIIVLLCLTALFAGLNLGLMSLDKNELQVVAIKGSDSERAHAKAIGPLRRRGNFLLCTILLSNVCINATVTVLIEELTSGPIAVIASTLAITIFGDIVPQAICSRHGLAIGAKTIWIMYFFMLLTSPLSYPISKILDWCLGEEIGAVYDREKLMEFIRVTKDYNKLEPSEVNIISGALELKRKTVAEIMTRLEDVFMLPISSRLDFETVSKIQKSGYSRIPVYREDRKNIVALFYAKDLAFVDPDDNMPLKTVIEYYKHPLIFTFDDTTLDVALGAFKEGKSHLSFVRHLYDSDTSDPYYEVIGVVTLEDVIEEILQTEIVDETDIITDNRLKQRRKAKPESADLLEFARIGEGQDATIVSPQMILAAFQYLSSSCLPFTTEYLSSSVLRRLMGQKIYFQHVVDLDKDEKEPNFKLYTKDLPVDYFVMILEGRAQVTAGQESLAFFSGPFSCFGIDALKTSETTPNEANETGSVYKPDFTVELVQTTTYLQVPRKLYLSAVKASQMEKASGLIGTDVGKALAKQITKDSEITSEMILKTNNTFKRNDSTFSFSTKDDSKNQKDS
ncbi:unextended protein-like [Panonychus citri]|uniref:unextended protein-like n=1 Tax=Panonychus citri TaxID=50023 RepID=UPI002307A081|nr:unextended protein-like [Panonychus citri]